MKVKILKAHKMLKPDQEMNLPDEYAKGLVKKGIAKEISEESTEKKSKK